MRRVSPGRNRLHLDTLICRSRYYLPEHVSEHVDYIKPGVTLSPPLEKKTLTRRDLEDLEKRDVALAAYNSGAAAYSNPYVAIPATGNTGPEAPGANALPANLRFCGFEITIDCIRALYDIPMGTANTPQNALGVLEFYPDVYSQQDLNMFYKAFAPYVPQGTSPNLVSIDGGKAPIRQKLAGGESDIDFSLAIPLVYPQSVTLYQVGPISFNSYNAQQYENQVTFVVPFLDGTSFKIDKILLANIWQQRSMEASAPMLIARLASNAV